MTTDQQIAVAEVRGPQPGRARRLVERYERPLLGVLGVALLLTAWEVATATGYVNRVIMSSPSGVLRALQSEIARGEIWGHLWISIVEYTFGFGLAAAGGILIGLIGGWWRGAYYVVDPWLTILYSTPTVALVPLIILVFGIDLWSKVFVVFLTAIFPIAVNTLIGVQSTARALLDVARTYGASPGKQWSSVVLPGSLPFILTGLRLGGVHGMVGVVVAELIAGNEGIGYVINLAGAQLKTGTVMLAILFLGLWGIGVGELMRRAEARFERWRA
jgi:NitT/TauT family transport system permease protein